MPATSPPVRSSTSTAKPFLSQYLMYMRSSIAAQSCASVPPEPAWMSTKQLLGSSGLENMRRNSSAATSLSRRDASRPISSSVASSASARAMSNSSFASARPLPTRPSVPTTASSAFFSLPSACARCGLSHSFGSSSSRFSAARRLCFASKSKIPPQLGRPGQQVGERGGNLVYAFGFHFLPPSLAQADRKSTRLNSSHTVISYAVFCLLPRRPLSTLFPYTTLFRSLRVVPQLRVFELAVQRREAALLRLEVKDTSAARPTGSAGRRARRQSGLCVRLPLPAPEFSAGRSEEHTSELQSHSDLVCRLLLAPSPTAIYTLSLHDALPISAGCPTASGLRARGSAPRGGSASPRSQRYLRSSADRVSRSASEEAIWFMRSASTSCPRV